MKTLITIKKNNFILTTLTSRDRIHFHNQGGKIEVEQHF